MMRLLTIAALLLPVDDLETLKKKFDEDKAKPYAERVGTITKIGGLKTDAAADFLERIFTTDKDESVRSASLSNLGTCGTPRAVAILLAVAKDEAATVSHRAAALSGLGRTKSKEALDFIVTILRNRDPKNTLRLSAAGALQQFPLKETESLWRDLLVDPVPTIVGYALRALAPLKDAKVLETARKVIEDPKETEFVKEAAVDCWKAVGTAEMVKVLFSAAPGADSGLSGIIFTALTALKDAAARDAVVAGAKSLEPAVRMLVMRVLAKLPHDKAMETLVDALHDKSDSVRTAAIEAIADRKDAKSEELLQKEAQKGDETAMRVLAGYPSKSTVDLLIKLAEKPKVGIAAVDALATIGTPEVLPALVKALKSKEWPMRAAAIKGLGKIKLKEAVDALIDALAKEEGRLAGDAAEALAKLTGKDLGPDAKHWKDWWKQQREGFAFPAKAGAGAGAGTTYCGVPVTSKRIIFCLDISGSMSAKIGTESRLEQAKKELSRVLKELDKATMVNMIFFDNQQEPWQKQMMLIKPNLEGALKKVSELQPRGGTNIYDTLEMAFLDPNCDTIFLLSDGAPGSGKFVNTEEILREIKKLNATRQIAIHTISLGKSEFMKKLAEQNSGQYVEK